MPSMIDPGCDSFDNTGLGGGGGGRRRATTLDRHVGARPEVGGGVAIELSSEPSEE